MKITEQLKIAGIRCEMDQRDEKVGYKIREAQLEKVPYMLILGRKEEEEGTISLRGRDSQSTGQMSLDAFIEFIQKEIAC